MNNLFIAMKCMKSRLTEKLLEKRGELGLGTLISIAVAIIVAAFVMIPGLRSFGASVLSSMTDWWTNTVQNDIFPTS